MRNPRETWDITSSYLGRKKEISQKKKYQRTSQSGNEMNKIIKTINKIPEIMLMVLLRS